MHGLTWHLLFIPMVVVRPVTIFVLVGIVPHFMLVLRSRSPAIALGPSEAEYVGMSEVSKAIIRFRQVLAAIGFPQQGPTVMLEDSNSAIKLAEGPSIKRKSKHIFVREYYVHNLHKQHITSFEQVPTAQQNADLSTKPKTPTKHFYEAERLLNKSNK
jgi:hypothetical protein